MWCTVVLSSSMGTAQKVKIGTKAFAYDQMEPRQLDTEF